MNRIDSQSKGDPIRNGDAKPSFAREIALVLLIKVVLIVAIKFAFFSDPVKKTEVVHRMDAAFLSGSTASETHSSSGSQRTPP